MASNNNEFEVLTLTDENGSLLDFEFIGAVELDGNEYYALIPLQNNPEREYIVLRVEDAGDGEVNFIDIEDDDEFDRVADLVEDEFFSEIDYDDLKGNE
ncbi:MAG: DUF1292 domain-containing protein [Clostridia bacterium]|nr:DUF1292 domain-containing protein [Clostridia bacterium]